MRIYAYLLVFLWLAPAQMRPADWRPVGTDELTRKTPKVDPGADAEAIFWDVHVEDRLQGSNFSLSLIHYVRIKIFTDRGKEKFATVEIPRLGRTSISDVAARTVKPDGSVVELTKESIFDRELLKTKGLKVKGKTFALPNVEVGDVVEYRYRETHEDETASYMHLLFQRDIPMWSVTYHLKPLQLPWAPFQMRTLPFQCHPPAFHREPDGFYSTSLTDVPAFREESDMPPEEQVRAWVLIYYEAESKADPDKYWKQIGKEDFSNFKPRMKADNLVKNTAAELTSGIDASAAKLSALGRLMFFDPTDPYVPVGYLPEHEQASLALVGVPGTGDLVRVPVAPAAARDRVRQVEATLKSDGSITGSFVERMTGESFAGSAGKFRVASKADFNQMLERWLAWSIPGVAISGLTATEQGGAFVLRGEFAAPKYAQLPQAGTIIFRAGVLRHRDALRLTEKNRKYPIVMDADALQESVKIALPEGFKVDEAPDAIHIESPFGKYDAKWESTPGALVFNRKIEVRAQSVPADSYAALRTFLDGVYGSAEMPVVLVK